MIVQVEESYLSAEEFCRMIGQESSAVLQNELAVLQGVGFDLVVYNPYHPLDGFLQACDCAEFYCIKHAAQHSQPSIHTPSCRAGLMLWTIELTF